MNNIFLPLALFAAVLMQGDDNFAKREKATVYLKANLPGSIAVLAIGEKLPDPEIAARCKSLLDAHYLAEGKRLDGKLLPKGRKKLPEICFLPISWPNRHGLVSDLTSYADQFIKIWEPWDDPKARGQYATQMFLRHLIEQRTPVAEVQALLDKMGQDEADYEKQKAENPGAFEHGGP